MCGLCMGMNSDRCPNNPENCREEADEAVRYFAFSLRSRKNIEVTEATWLSLPVDEDTAEAFGRQYCRQDADNVRPGDMEKSIPAFHNWCV